MLLATSPVLETGRSDTVPKSSCGEVDLPTRDSRGLAPAGAQAGVSNPSYGSCVWIEGVVDFHYRRGSAPTTTIHPAARARDNREHGAARQQSAVDSASANCDATGRT